MASILPNGLISDQEMFALCNILLKDGFLTQENFDKAKLAYVASGKPLSEYLLSQNMVTLEDIFKARAVNLKIGYIKLSDTALSPLAMSYVDQTLASRFSLMPFDYKANTGELFVAMINPLDLAAIQFLERKTGLHVRPFVALPLEIQDSIVTQYQQSLSTEVTQALKEAGGPTGTQQVKTINVRKLGEVIREAPIAKIVSTVLDFAAKSRASDVHIEPLEEKTRVRYRIDGILHEKLVLPKNIHEALISRIKILSDMKIDEKRVPQDGRFNFETETEQIDLRVSSLPTVYGEKIVMRLLKKTGVVPTLQELGLRGKALTHIEDSIRKPHGIILVTGPTGSGKTTTLYSVLTKISTVKVNVVTLEDPVEYQVAGVNQVQINPAAGLTFASGLRSFLRQDPNVIMVGEIRDEETAELAVQASLTGHLVFSTLHTNSASGALPRLLDMKAEPYLLASSMTVVVGQRVARKICDVCKVQYAPPPETVASMKQVLGKLWKDESTDISNIKLWKGQGCVQCSGVGYRGRVGIFEVLPITEKIARLILERSSAGDIENEAVSEGMITMKQDGYLKVVEGITTIEEVLRIAQE